MNQNQIIASAVAKFESHDLRHVRRTVEAEMLAAVARGEEMTQAHVGQIELLTAIGAELDRRNELRDPPPYFDTCWVDGHRLSFQVRVF
jgi:hypothetical protein